jgi:V8-like Glu-specific endopeptidase
LGPEISATKPIRLVLAIALAALCLGASAATASAAWHAGTESATQRGGALGFWTPARMKSARPLSVQLPGSSAHLVGKPAPAAGASSVFETVPDPTGPLTRQNGAIFVVLGFAGFNEVARCSGTSIKAPNFSVVFTAGHCVREGRHWLGNKWVFVPGYHNGQRPFGVFQAKWLDAPPQWVQGNNENYDVAAAVVSRNEQGQRLGEAVGGAGIAWGLSPRQSFDVYGYPVAPPFNGATLQHCPQTPFEGHDLLSLLSPGPLNLAVECNVTGGASGGGWFTPDGRLNGVTTYGHPGDPATDFGPYFGKEVGKLFARAAAVK